MPDCENFDNIQLAPNAILNTIENSGNDPDSLNISEQKRKRYEQNTLHRNFLVHWVAWVISLWLLIVINVIIANAKLKLGMESEVQITLLATTTVNVLGLAYIVLKGLFGET